MKKVIIYLLCFMMFWQNSLATCALEIDGRGGLLQEEQAAEEEEEQQPSEEEEEQQPSEEEEEQQPSEEEEEQQPSEEEEEQQPSEEEEQQPSGEEEEQQPSEEEEEQQPIEDEKEQPPVEQEKVVEEDQQCSDSKVESVVSGQQKEDEDPQFGREKGFLDSDFAGIESFTNRNLAYVHAEKFDDYIIKNVIDVSKYQGDIDWTKVKQSGIDYAIIRAGFRGYGKEGTLNIDEKFLKNIKGAIAAGIEVGVYFFSQAITEAEAVAEAEYVLELIDEYNVSLPVVMDFEYASSSDGLVGRLFDANLSKETATKICKEFCITVENAGYTAMVYANKGMLENGLNASEIAEDYMIWLANYTTCTTYEGEYDFWQYTQNGAVDGISGNVDKSFWYEKIDITYAEISEGIYTISTCLDTGKVIDIPNASLSNGLNLQIYKSNGTWAQKFYIRPETEDTYVIMSANSGKVLEASNNGVCQNSYTGAEKQQWRFMINEDGSYAVRSADSKLVMGTLEGKSENQTRIQMYRLNKSIEQSFQLNAEDAQTICDVKDGSYIIESVLMEDKVLNQKADGENLEIRTLTVTDSQKFQLEYVGNGCYRVVSDMNQKVLTAGDDKSVLFTEINSNVMEQRWIMKKNMSNTYTMISAKDGMNLDVADVKTAEGTRIQKYAGNGTAAQQFKLYETQVGDEKLEEGIYIIHSAADDTKVLDVYKESKISDANIQLYQSKRIAAQKFIVKGLENGFYGIFSYNSGMAVTVENGENANEVNVHQYFPIGGNSQQWKIVPVGKGYYNVISCIGNKVLDVSGGKTANGTNIQIYTNNGTKAQKFRFEKISDIEEEPLEKELSDGTYTICSALNENKVLDVANGSLHSGANVQLYTSNNTSAQQFIIQKNTDTGLYSIISKKSGMNLTYKDGVLKNSVNVYQDTELGENGQQWNIKHILDDYFMIYASNSNFCLDVDGAKTANGTNIKIYTAKGNKAQIFKLKRISGQTLTEQNAYKKLKDGLYIISTSLNGNMVLDVASGSKNDGANIQLYKSNNTNAQKFIVQQLENGNYTLTALCSDKIVSVDGTNVCQKNAEGLLNQEWKIVCAGNGYYTLMAPQSGKVLDVDKSKTVNETNIKVYTSSYNAAQRFEFTQTTTIAEAKFVSDENDGYSVNYEVYTKGNETSADKKYYLMQADSYSGKIYGSPITSVEQNFEVLINVQVADRSKLKELAMDKLVLAVKLSDGTYKAVTNPVSISNPEAIAKNTSAIFKASSKKGVQGVTYASSSNDPHPKDARYTNTKQTLLNLDIAEVVNPESDYTTFSYKGKTYKFSKCSALVADIKSLNAGYKQYMYGNSGTTKVAVSLCLLLSYDSDNKFLIDPAARSAGHAYYLLNVREDTARETLEALFVYLGELFGQNDCYVTNWILGNEINSSKAWNYGGSLNFDTYMNCYTTAFRMLYNAVKSEKTGNTVSISLDNGWAAAPDTYAGKTTLDSFAKKINAENPNIEWSIAYHPYSYPLTRVDFWNDSSNTTNSTSTKYISMKNISVLTDYVASLEKTYKMDTGSIRVLLTEQGYSYSGGADTQATAIARGYYIAEFNDRIDTFIIRALVDDAEEAKGKLYLGIMNGFTDKRTSFFVYEFMDSDLSKLKSTSASSVVTEVNYGRFNSAKNILCNTNWKSYVSGFNAAKLAGIK